MWCPTCRCEFVESVQECPECREALVDASVKAVRGARYSAHEFSGGVLTVNLSPVIDVSAFLKRLAEDFQRANEAVVGAKFVFEIGAVGVAMSNAVDEVRDAADFVTPHSCEDDGVARFLEEAFL